MAYYRTCPHCGSNLDPGETCTCEEEREQEILSEHAEQRARLITVFERKGANYESKAYC